MIHAHLYEGRITKTAAWLVALPLALALQFAPAPARAEGTPTLSPAAERLFNDGLKLAHGGDCTRARDKFTESYAIDPAPGTLINWALCEEKLGRSATALELLRLADQTLPANHPKRAGMVKHMEILRKRAPILRVRLVNALPEGSTLAMDGAIVETSAFSRGVLGDPGAHVVEIRVPGHEDRRYEVVLAEATTLEVTVQPGATRAPGKGAADGKVAPEGPSSAASPDATEGSSSSSTLGWALAGGGLASIGAGVVTGLLAKGQWDSVSSNCDVERKVCRNDDGIQASSAGDTLAAVSTAAFIAGGASLAVGGYLLLTTKDAPATARVSTAAGPGVLGLRLSGEF
ncbi:MAG: hypothetical protein ABW133_03920 [Polyangiaceae bacterium]